MRAQACTVPALNKTTTQHQVHPLIHVPAVHLEETENINTSCYFGVITRIWQLVCFFSLSNILTPGRLSALTHTKINSALKLLVKAPFPEEFFIQVKKWAWRKLHKRYPQRLGHN